MRKKLFAVIMSVMMMVTFMPMMAFAGETHLSTDHELSVEVTGWNADYSKANVEVCCSGEKGAVVATTTVDTERNFKENEGYIVVSVSKTNIEKAVNTRMSGLYNGGTPATYNIDSVEVNKDAGVMDNDAAKTIYYDFTGALLTDGTGTVIEEMTADQYLNLKYLVSNTTYMIKFTEPSTIDSFDKKAKYGYVGLKVAKRHDEHGNSNGPDSTTLAATDNAPKKDAGYEMFGYFFMNLKKMVKQGSSVIVTADANPDVRVDTELPEYTPYTDGITLDLPLQFRAYSYIEPVHVYGLSTDKTQKVKISTNSNELNLYWQILTLKGDTSETIIPRRVALCDTEKEALRLGMYNQMNGGSNWVGAPYTGEDQGFEVKTQNVSVEYGTIDDMGNVTYSATAPEVINVKTEQDGYYHDKDYHFIVKISKGSKTVYMPVAITVTPATVNFTFLDEELYAGVGEKLNVKDLVKLEVNGGKYEYAADKANLETYLDKFVTLTDVDTSYKHMSKIGLSVTAKTTKDVKEAFDEQFLANFNFNNNSVQTKLYVTDAANQIKFSNRTKSFHVKNSAKLKSTKKFQLKATANYGKVTFKKITGKYNKIKVSKTGKVTVKKGLKKGTYNVKVKAFAPCKEVTRTIKIKVRY